MQASLSWYTRKEILPRTQAICLAGLVDRDVAKLCYAFVAQLGAPARSGLVATFMPLCQPVCWHSCAGTSNQDRDGFHDCRDPSCANTPCASFLMTCASKLEPPNTRDPLIHKHANVHLAAGFEK